jgi:RNA polymerase sigma factor (sigma-70 family)
MSAAWAALGTLPRQQREAVILRYYAELSEKETAAAMDISEGAVKSHAHRGMAALRQRLDARPSG